MFYTVCWLCPEFQRIQLMPKFIQDRYSQYKDITYAESGMYKNNLRVLNPRNSSVYVNT